MKKPNARQFGLLCLLYFRGRTRGKDLREEYQRRVWMLFGYSLPRFYLDMSGLEGLGYVSGWETTIDVEGHPIIQRVYELNPIGRWYVDRKE